MAFNPQAFLFVAGSSGYGRKVDNYRKAPGYWM